jgi:DNA-binding MarR family transcriptional regulator
VDDDDYRALSDFRHHLRRFLAFSERAARDVGLEPRQHQVLLALRALPHDVSPTVGALAERMVLRHHTVVELVDRLERRGLVRRTRARDDRRRAEITITARGVAQLEKLSLAHREELASTGHDLVTALRRVLRGVDLRGAA